MADAPEHRTTTVPLPQLIDTVWLPPTLGMSSAAAPVPLQGPVVLAPVTTNGVHAVPLLAVRIVEKLLMQAATPVDAGKTAAVPEPEINTPPVPTFASTGDAIVMDSTATEG